MDSMQHAAARHPVRLGLHGGRPVFVQAKGLHDDAAGLSVVAGGSATDPLVMFEEHGTEEVCQYFVEQRHGLLAPGLQPNIHSPMLRQLVGDEDVRRNWFAIRGIFGQEDPVYVNELMLQLRGELGAGGLASLIEISRRFQRRTALFRLLATAQSQPARPLADIVGAPHPLDHHTGGAHLFVSYLYEPLLLMGSPFTRGFSASRGIQESSQTLLLVSMAGSGEGQLLKDDEVTWATVYETDLPALRALAADGTTWMRRTNHTIHHLDAAQLIAWWTRSLNRLFTEVSDLGRYRRDDDLLDAGRAYRELRTLERIIANCVRIQARPTDHLMRVALSYEFFDLLPNLIRRRLTPGRVWDRLANPTHATKILKDAFAQTPEAVKKCLGARTDAVLTRLRDETLQHVVAGLATGRRIIVAGKPYARDTFIAQLMHQLRNTHHGYELDATTKNDLLTAHTGHISDAFPELVVLYTIALICNPAATLDGAWFRT